MPDSKAPVIAIIGLGYVGLPLAVAFAKQYAVIGYDINKGRISSLNNGEDLTLEIESKSLKTILKIDNTTTKGLYLSSDSEAISKANYYIITVPTPTDALNAPILKPLEVSSTTVAHFLKPKDTVIYESTVYPGVTEDFCVPILERISGLEFNKDFFVGYSPERVNPGDKERTITKILKITSGSTPETANNVNTLYASIINAGTHKVSSIKVAEAAKVIENSQRDINIAFINELSKIFRLLDIDTQEVLDAAATKWNFMPFKPGLVGGHCIGVDPYYLAHKAIDSGYNPGIILAGRKMNDSMGGYIAKESVRLMIEKDILINKSRALVMGITFKEDCPDIRNSKVIDIIDELKKFHLNVDVFDPWADVDEVKLEYNLDLLNHKLQLNNDYQLIIIAVAHKVFLDINLIHLRAEKSVVFDVKALFPKDMVDSRL